MANTFEQNWIVFLNLFLLYVQESRKELKIYKNCTRNLVYFKLFSRMLWLSF